MGAGGSTSLPLSKKWIAQRELHRSSNAGDVEPTLAGYRHEVARLRMMLPELVLTVEPRPRQQPQTTSTPTPPPTGNDFISAADDDAAMHPVMRVCIGDGETCRPWSDWWPRKDSARFEFMSTALFPFLPEVSKFTATNKRSNKSEWFRLQVTHSDLSRTALTLFRSRDDASRTSTTNGETKGPGGGGGGGGGPLPKLRDVPWRVSLWRQHAPEWSIATQEQLAFATVAAGPHITAFCSDRLGTWVGDRECWSLGAEAMASLASNGLQCCLPTQTCFGWEVPAEEVGPGDVLQFYEAEFCRTDAEGDVVLRAGFPHHTAVVEKVEWVRAVEDEDENKPAMSTEALLEDGSVLHSFATGGHCRVFPDGAVLLKRHDESTLQVEADGVTMVEKTPGSSGGGSAGNNSGGGGGAGNSAGNISGSGQMKTTTQWFPDGSVLLVRGDGSRTQTEADGSVIHSSRKGGVSQGKPTPPRKRPRVSGFALQESRKIVEALRQRKKEKKGLRKRRMKKEKGKSKETNKTRKNKSSTAAAAAAGTDKNTTTLIKWLCRSCDGVNERPATHQIDRGGEGEGEEKMPDMPDMPDSVCLFCSEPETSTHLSSSGSGSGNSTTGSTAGSMAGSDAPSEQKVEYVRNFHVFEQNRKTKVKRGAYMLSTLVSGTVTCFRPAVGMAVNAAPFPTQLHY